MPTIEELKIQIKNIAPKQAVSGKKKAELMAILEALSAPPKPMRKRPVVAPDSLPVSAPPKRKRPVVAPSEPVKKSAPFPFRELPTDIIDRILATVGYAGVQDFGKVLPFNVSEVFSLGKTEPDKRTIAIISLLGRIAKASMIIDYPGFSFDNLTEFEKKFYEARANEYPIESIERLSEGNERSKDALIKIHNAKEEETFTGRMEMEIEAPTKEQSRLLEKMFNNKINFDLRRRQGTMGNKSGIVLNWTANTDGINKRTKEGRAEIKQIYKDASNLAKQYLNTINKNIPQILLLGKDMRKRTIDDVKKTKEEVRKEAIERGVVIAPTRRTAVPVPPEMFVNILELFYGDKKKAEEEANELKRKFPGKSLIFFGKKRLNFA